jgi:hypothetical protein
MIGPCIAFLVFLRIVAQQATPPAESMALNVASSLAITLGLGLGPMVSPAVTWCTGVNTVEQRAAVSSYAFAILWACIFIFSALCVPTDTAEVVQAAEELRNSNARNALAQADAPKRLNGSRLPKEQGRMIWWSGLWFNAQRTFIIAALEAATAFVLQDEFGWGAQLVGLAVGATYLATLLPSLTYLKLNGFARDTHVLRWAAAIGLLAPMMFFPMPAMSSNSAAAIVLLTDCIVFSAGFVANGLMDGFATNNCESDTFYSIANYMLAAQFIKIVPRIVTPVLTRYLLSNVGRGMYAGLQLAIASIGCWTCFHAASLMDGQTVISWRLRS